MAKIAVTGVTGHLGRIVIDDLLDRVPPSDLVAVARTPAKASDLAARGVEVRHGDYDEAASLASAFAGVDTLLLVSGPDAGVRVAQHRSAVEQAERAGVGRLVYTSAISADNAQGFLADHTKTEAAIRESGVAFTLLRNTFYSEGFVGPALAQAKESGEVTSSAAGHRLNTATRRDLALAASATLDSGGHDDKVYELRGPLWTYPDLADALARALGEPVTYREITDEEAGPAAFIYGMVRADIFAEPGDDLATLLGRPATDLAGTIAELNR